MTGSITSLTPASLWIQAPGLSGCGEVVSKARTLRSFESGPSTSARSSVKLLVTRVGIRDGGDRAHVLGESLGEEEILRGPVDVCDGRVAERVEVVMGLKAPPLACQGLGVTSRLAEHRK
jgi:hypothetical protein